MNLLFSSLLLSGLSVSLAGPSPQWLYQQIHALPVKDELHAKKSEIPQHKKRKDGVKRLFQFLDSAIVDSGSGSGEGSSQEPVTMATKNSSALSSPPSRKQKQIIKSPNESQLRVKGAESLTNEQRTGRTGANTSFTGHRQLFSTGFSGSGAQSIQVANRYAGQGQQGAQRASIAPQKTAGYTALSESKISSYSPNISQYTRSQAQRTVTGYTAAGHRMHPYGHTILRTRPPAIPVRSQVTGNEFRSQHSLATAQQLLGGPHRSNIQSPYYITTTTMGPNEYGGYNVDAHGIPVAPGKSPEPLQLKAYGQLKRQRDQFHQQSRALIPGRVPFRTYARYPYPLPQRNLAGEVRGIVQRRLPYQRENPLISRAKMPQMQRAVMAASDPARIAGQVYYRNHIPQQQSSIAFTEHLMRSHGYPLRTQASASRAVINRKPQPGTAVTSLAAATARLAVPARPEAYENSATAESIGFLPAPYPGAHAVTSNIYPGQ